MPPCTFLILVSEYLILGSAEIYLAQCGDILLTNGCISSSEAEKEEGVGKRFGESNPTCCTPRRYQAPGLRESTNSAKTRSTIAFP
jgi:hypothetical protein